MEGKWPDIFFFFFGGGGGGGEILVYFFKNGKKIFESFTGPFVPEQFQHFWEAHAWRL